MPQKRLVTIQDISCFGKCSLTVALPIISAVGVETVILPTAVLSTHTYGFSGFTFNDLTSDIQKISDHWASIPLDFDAIYTGYLGSFEQLKLVSDFFTRFKGENTSIIVDPVMGDNGKLYTGFTPEFAVEMAKLCRKADYILPNMTEACFMLGIPYKNEDYDGAYIEKLLRDLCKLGAKTSILTGVSLRDGKYDKSVLGTAAYNAEKDEFTYYFRDRIDCSFHGTGDVFASVFSAALVRGKDLYDSMRLAADYVCDCIEHTMLDQKPCKYGVKFEECIPQLLKSFELI